MPSVLIFGLLWLMQAGRAVGQPVAPRLPPDTEAGLGMLRAQAGRTKEDSTPFEGDSASVSDQDFLLLLQNGYHFDDDGRLYPPDTQTPLTQGEFPYALEDARSRARLKALLQLNVILNRNDFAKKLPPQDRQAVRDLGRENWELFSKSTRKDLRRFFSPAELAQLDEKLRGSQAQAPAAPVLTQGPAADEARGLAEANEEPMFKDIPLASIPEKLLDFTFDRQALPPPAPSSPSPMFHVPRRRRIRARPAPAAPSPAPATSAGPTPTPAVAPQAPEIAAPGSRAEPERAMPAPWSQAAGPALPPALPSPAPMSSAPEIAAGAPAMPESASAPSAPTAPTSGEPQFRVTAAPEPPVAAVQGLDDSLAQLKPTKSMPLPAPPPRPRSFNELSIFSVPDQPGSEYPEFKPENFKAFLESAPYGHGVKPLLQLLADHARDPERRIALGLAQLYLPHIILDSQKSGARTASISRIPASDGSPERWQIALNDQPLLAREHHLFLGSKIFLLPDDPDFYRARALPPPALQAFSREAASDHDKDAVWGRLRVYGDGSLRLRLSDEELAGMLVRELIRLDCMQRGWDWDSYHTELRASAAQFKFYKDLSEDAKKEPPLDKDTLARYKSWLERPEEYESFVLQTLSAPRQGARGDPREEVSLLAESGVVNEATAQRTRESLPASGEKEGSLDDWIKASAGPSEAQAAWLGLEKQARRKP